LALQLFLDFPPAQPLQDGLRTKLGATITLSDTTSAPGGGRYATFMQPMIELEIDLVRIVRKDSYGESVHVCYVHGLARISGVCAQAGVPRRRPKCHARSPWIALRATNFTINYYVFICTIFLYPLDHPNPRGVGHTFMNSHVYSLYIRHIPLLGSGP
jgi:hypothetical protein